MITEPIVELWEYRDAMSSQLNLGDAAYPELDALTSAGSRNGASRQHLGNHGLGSKLDDQWRMAAGK